MKIRIERFIRPTMQHPYGELEVSYGSTPAEHFSVSVHLEAHAMIRNAEQFEADADAWVEEAKRKIRKAVMDKMEIEL